MTALEEQLTKALRRLSAQPAGEVNRGRESYKSNWGCTICASCRCTGPCWTMPRKRGRTYLNGGTPARAASSLQFPTPAVDGKYSYARGGVKCLVP